MDYQGNPNKGRDQDKPPEKKIEKVVTGEVIKKSKSPGRKFKEIFFGGDLKYASRTVVADVVLPAFRDLVFDAIINGARGVVYGENMRRRGRPTDYRSITTYNNPITTSSRAYDPRDPRTYPRDPRDLRRANLPDQPSRYRLPSPEKNDFIIVNRADAEEVVERLYACLERYEVVSLADFYDSLGWKTSPIDNNWGWTYLGKLEIRQVRDGFSIELPPLEAL